MNIAAVIEGNRYHAFAPASTMTRCHASAGVSLPALTPLHGIRVLDLSRMVAGGFAGMLLADFGAEVVKVEQPGSGDPLRQWTTGGAPLWWKVYGRNKRFITLNIAAPRGRDMLLRLLPRFDVMLESFVPGTMEKWQLDW